jgi:hypothetical protein
MSYTQEQKAAFYRKNAQCLLIHNLKTASSAWLRPTQSPSFAANAKKQINRGANITVKKPAGRTEEVQKTVSYYGRPELLVNALTKTRTNPSTFVHGTAGQLSLLQPALEFYIRTNEKEPVTGQSVPTDTPVVFSDYVNAETMIKLSQMRDGDATAAKVLNNKDGSGFNVGIKEFSWNYDNKHEGDRIIKAQLVLYFGSMTELVNKRYLDFIFTSPRRTGVSSGTPDETTSEAIHRMRKDLNARAGAISAGINSDSTISRKETAHPLNSKQLKVVVGWQEPGRKVSQLFNSQTECDAFYDAVRNSKKVLLLNLTRYDLTFNQNGSVQLVCEYIASTDSWLLSPEANVLAQNAVNENTSRNEEAVGIATGRNAITRLLPTPSTLGSRLSLLWGASGGPWDNTTNPSEGYLHRVLKSALSGGTFDRDPATDREVFYVWPSAVLAECEWLEERLELFDLETASKTKSQNKGLSQQMQDQRDKWRQALDEALAIYEECLVSYRSTAYSKVLERLMYGAKLFIAQVNPVDIGTFKEGEIPNFKGSEITLAGSPLNGARYRNRLRSLATVVQDAKSSGKTPEEILAGEVSSILNPFKVPAPGSEGEENPDYVAPDDPLLPQQNNQPPPMYLYYLRLGDIIQAASDLCMMPTDHQIILGSFSPVMAKINRGKEFGATDYVSIADIPISVEYFGQWLFDYVISLESSTYSFRRFLDDILHNLVSPIFNELCVGESGQLSLGYTTATGLSPINAPYLQNALNPKYPGANSSTVNCFPVDEMVISPIQRSLEQAVQAGKNRPLTTFILVHAEQVNRDRTGNRLIDENDGIYHYFVGADRGIVKSFDFSQKQMPQLRAMNIEKTNQGATAAGILVLPMDVSLRMFGNSLHQNGSMLFVNADMGVGSQVADILKLGGYYRVVRSSHVITPGSYETTVDCIFERQRVDL